MASGSKQRSCDAKSNAGPSKAVEEILYSAGGCEFVTVKSEPVSSDEDLNGDEYCRDGSYRHLEVIKEEPPTIDLESDDSGSNDSFDSMSQDASKSSRIPKSFYNVEEERPIVELDIPLLDMSDLAAKLNERNSTHVSRSYTNGYSDSGIRYQKSTSLYPRNMGELKTGGFSSFPTASQSRVSNEPYRNISLETNGFRSPPSHLPSQTQPVSNGPSRYPVLCLTRLSESLLRSPTVKLSPSVTRSLAAGIAPKVPPVRPSSSPYVPVKGRHVVRKDMSTGPKGALSNMFYCHHCDYVSKNKSSLACHALGHLPRQFHCKVCPYKSITKKYLKLHMHVHTGQKALCCPLCGYKTRWVDNLKTHLLTHSEERNYQCPLCSYRAKTRATLKSHMKAHNDVRNHQCPYCPYAAIHKQILKEHITKHTGEKNRVCPHCEFRTGRGSSLRDHIRLKHVRIKNLQCPHCDYKSAHKGNMKSHVRTHTKERPYPCEQCDYAGATSNSLRLHVRTHSGVRQYACDYCSYRSIQRSTMRAHVDRIHFKINHLQCYHCDYRNYRKRSIRIHIESVHLGITRLRCRVAGCRYQTLSRSCMSKHKRKHEDEKPFFCGQCTYRSRTQDMMKRHLVSHTRI